MNIERRPYRKMTSREDDLTGRRPHRKTTSQEDDLQSRMTSMLKDNLTEVDLNGSVTGSR